MSRGEIRLTGSKKQTDALKHIVERSLNGTINVESMPYRMTRFALLLPKNTLCVGEMNE